MQQCIKVAAKTLVDSYYPLMSCGRKQCISAVQKLHATSHRKNKSGILDLEKLALHPFRLHFVGTKLSAVVTIVHTKKNIIAFCFD
jgi:hypothetical protein